MVNSMKVTTESMIQLHKDNMEEIFELVSSLYDNTIPNVSGVSMESTLPNFLFPISNQLRIISSTSQTPLALQTLEELQDKMHLINETVSSLYTEQIQTRLPEYLHPVGDQLGLIYRLSRKLKAPTALVGKEPEQEETSFTQSLYAYNCRECGQEVIINVELTQCIGCGEEETLSLLNSYDGILTKVN